MKSLSFFERLGGRSFLSALASICRMRSRVTRDVLEDEKSKAPQDFAEAGMLREQLGSVLNTLTPREEMVIRLRYGFGGARPRIFDVFERF